MPQSFVNQATARCSVNGAKFWFSCNPNSPFHWFKKEWINKLDEHNILYLHFTMDDNYSLSEEEEFSSFKSYYEKEISNYRNALGHRKSTDNVIEITKGNYVPIDEALHQKMRKNLKNLI